MNEQEIAKYRKKKDSNVSFSKKKTKHKHEYIKCYLRFPAISDHLWFGQVCAVCGKTKSTLSEKFYDGKYYYLPTNEELLALHPDWKIVDTEI